MMNCCRSYTRRRHRRWHLIAGDAAAVHIEGAAAAVHIHAAASALGVLGFVAGNRAAVHIEGAGTHIHASAGLAACMGDRADALGSR